MKTGKFLALDKCKLNPQETFVGPDRPRGAEEGEAGGLGCELRCELWLILGQLDFLIFFLI